MSLDETPIEKPTSPTPNTSADATVPIDSQRAPLITKTLWNPDNQISPRYAIDSVSWSVRDVRVPGTDRIERYEFPTGWSDTACQIAATKYLRVRDGVKETSWREAVRRVAGSIASHGWKAGYYKDEAERGAHYSELVYLLVNQMMAFNSPVWFNVGVDENPDGPQVSACFITPIEDSMESISNAHVVQSEIFRRGSGNGTNYSRLRGSDEPLSGGGTSSGPLPFIQALDAGGGAVKSGGSTRRSASMVILDADHPDIQLFVKEKWVAERAAHALIDAGFASDFRDARGAYGLVPNQNANHSVRVSNVFMRAATADTADDKEACQWDLVNRVDQQVCKTIDASELLDTISESTWVCGDPGLQFDDAIQHWHTLKATDKIYASNPCQPSFATVLTPDGIRTFDDIDVGSTIWSGYRWTKVVRKIHTGTKPVYKYRTDESDFEFIGTETHRVMQNGQRVEVRDAESIDISSTPPWSPPRKSAKIIGKSSVGDFPVYDIEVDAPEHTYWTGGLLVSNCSEFLHLDNTSCNLASLNLVHFFGDGLTQSSFKRFYHAVDVTILAMEILVDMGGFPTPEIAEMTRKTRPLGLGYTNLGSLLMRLGYAYDSSKARSLAGMITSAMAARAYSMSARMAALYGPFELFAANREPMLEVISNHIANDGMPRVDEWQTALALGLEHGYRNSQVTVLAPTGTISFIMDCDTTGIEPALALVSYKTLVGGGSLRLVNKSVETALRRLGYSQDVSDRIVARIEQTGDAESALDVGLSPADLAVFDTAFPCKPGGRSISWQGHIEMMAAVQPFLSGAISKSVCVPHDTTPAEIREIYIAAWKAGLKAVAIYRDGSKRTQPLSTSKAGDKTSDKEAGNGAGETVLSNVLSNADRDALVQSITNPPPPTDALREARARHLASVVPDSTRASHFTPDLVLPIVEPSPGYHDHLGHVSNRLETQLVTPPVRERLPETRSAITHKFRIGASEGYITTGFYEDGRLGEVFIRMAKEGGPLGALLDAVATAVSIGLQHGIPLETYADKFVGTRFEPSGFTGSEPIHSASSPLDYIFKYLGQLSDGRESRGSGDDSGNAVGQDVITKPVVPVPATNVAVQGGMQGPPCSSCGSDTHRAGTCYVCSSCGTTTGCG